MLTLNEQSIHAGNLILVNASHGIQGDPEDVLVPACSRFPEILLQRCAATLLNELMKEIQGWDFIVPVSGYRSREEQQRIWDDSLRENGAEFTKKYVAVPGHSEHQTGLAIDLGLKAEHIDFIRPDFPYSGICQTFRERAAKYGFILRYPAGKEKITGISHEPWHFRYVGVPHAEIMVQRGLTLEEYTDFIRQFSYESKPYLTQNGSGQIQIGFLPPALAAQCAADLPEAHPHIISGNNVDGFILTEYLYGGSL